MLTVAFLVFCCCKLSINKVLVDVSSFMEDFPQTMTLDSCALGWCDLKKNATLSMFR